MTASGKNFLKTAYARNKLQKLGIKQASQSQRYLHDQYVSNRVNQIINEQMLAPAFSQILNEGIDVKLLQDYLGWFKEVKSFVNKHDLPTLKRATQDATKEMMDLFRGSTQDTVYGEKKPEGIVGHIKSWFSDPEQEVVSRSDTDRLSDVNHFLWGITTVLSALPTLIAALDTQLDGELLADPKDQLGEADEEAQDDSVKQELANPNITLEEKINSLNPEKGFGFIRQFKDLISRTFTQAVASFGAGEIPFISDPLVVADELLKMEIDEIQNLGKDALGLKSDWESRADQFKKTAVEIDSATKTADSTAAKPKSGEVQGKPGEKTTQEITLDDETISSTARKLQTRLQKVKSNVEKGKSITPKQKKALDAITAALEQLK